MKRALMLMVLAGCAGETSEGRTYNNNDQTLAVGNAAFMTCTCLWVMEMPEDHCSAWVKASPAVARVGIDYSNKTVESSAFVSWAAKARYIDDKRGCVLE